MPAGPPSFTPPPLGFGYPLGLGFYLGDYGLGFSFRLPYYAAFLRHRMNLVYVFARWLKPETPNFVLDLVLRLSKIPRRIFVGITAVVAYKNFVANLYNKLVGKRCHSKIGYHGSPSSFGRYADLCRRTLRLRPPLHLRVKARRA